MSCLFQQTIVGRGAGGLRYLPAEDCKDLVMEIGPHPTLRHIQKPFMAKTS